MPAKHSARPFGPARIILSAAAAFLVLLVVWVAARAVGPADASRPPWVAAPPLSSAPVTPEPPASTSPSALVLITSPSASPTRTTSRAKPSPTRTRRPSASPSRSSAPAARNDMTATVTVSASWEQGYVAGVRIRNTGNTTRSWSVTVTHSRQQNLTLRNTWSASGQQNGDSFTFTGGPLAAGATVNFGYQAAKNGRGDARPAGCTVVGGRCGVS